MRTILLIATVLALITLAVGGVSAHDGNQDDGQMDEMMDECMERIGQMGEMMKPGPMDGQEHSGTMDTAGHHNDVMSSEETPHTGLGNC